MAEQEIMNRVTKSGIETIDLAGYYPTQPIQELDIKDWLYHGLILKEKDFRESIETYDWESYRGQIVTIFCSADAIIPFWAYMLLASKLQPFAAGVSFGTVEACLSLHYQRVIDALDLSNFTDKRVVIKGCGDKAVPANAYVAITARLQPVAKAIMYGEPCSTVPVYKKPKAQQ